MYRTNGLQGVTLLLLGKQCVDSVDLADRRDILYLFIPWQQTRSPIKSVRFHNQEASFFYLTSILRSLGNQQKGPTADRVSKQPPSIEFALNRTSATYWLGRLGGDKNY